MIAFPNCKINLGLNILRKRTDGFHDIETVFYPLPIKDIVEIIHAESITNNSPGTPKTNGKSGVHFVPSGLEIPGEKELNLCIKAYHLLQKDFPDLPPIQLFLHKVIPIGAGLGGGSADGAFTLKLLNEKFQLKLKMEKLLDYALQLGSDCPFFILNRPCIATGRGEFLEVIQLDLSRYFFVLVNPGIFINTSWAFQQVTPSNPPGKIAEIMAQPIAAWSSRLNNAFEMPVFSEYPQLAEIKKRLYDSGAIYSSLSGSGSCIYGIFESEPEIDSLKGWKTYVMKGS